MQNIFILCVRLATLNQETRKQMARQNDFLAIILYIQQH